MRKVYNKLFCEWSEKVQRQLYLASFKNQGYMRDTILRYPEVDTFVMLDAGELIGWALVDGSGLAMFYVKRQYRRQGVARRLGKRIKRKYGRDETIYLHMVSHDRASQALEASLFSENLVAN